MNLRGSAFVARCISLASLGMTSPKTRSILFYFSANSFLMLGYEQQILCLGFGLIFLTVFVPMAFQRLIAIPIAKLRIG